MCHSNNFKLLKQNYPNIYSDIVKLSPNKYMYETILTKTGQATLKINKKAKSLYLHSRYNPDREAINIAEDNYDLNIKNYIIFGLGFGYHVMKMMEMAPNSNFHIIEPNKDVFRLVLDNVDLSSIIDNTKVNLYLTNDISEIGNILNNLVESLLIENVKIVSHKASLNALPEDLKNLKYILEEFQVFENSIERFSPILENNFISNIKNYNENVDILFNKFKNVPIYIISAGPSLDKNIKELTKIKGKGIIFSVGRAVRSLLNVGIEPDLIVITDPAPYLYDMQLNGLDIKVPIVVLSTCDKNVMLNYSGYKLIALQKGYTLAEEYAKQNKNKLVQTGGSVATTALDIAINMGCNPIIFVGQDLAFTNNKTHSETTFSKDITVHNNLREVEDVYGNKVYTPKNLYIYLRWIQNRISIEKNNTFIDATEGGARIIGTEVLTIRETIEKHSKRDIPIKIELLNQLR